MNSNDEVQASLDTAIDVAKSGIPEEEMVEQVSEVIIED